jgi:hypothetical protein
VLADELFEVDAEMRAVAAGHRGLVHECCPPARPERVASEGGALDVLVAGPEGRESRLGRLCRR